MNCLICGRETEAANATFCRAHNRALDNLRQAFSAWTDAYGNLSFPDFLKRVGKLPGTGQNAKEIVQFLQHDPTRWK